MDILTRGITPVETVIESRSGVTIAMSCMSGPNWSLAGLYSEAAAREKSELCGRVSLALRDMGATHVYAPTPTDFNAKIIDPDALDVAFPIGRNITMHRSTNKAVYADGTFLRRPGDAGVFSVGGCPMIILIYGHIVLFLHAGLWCLVDKKWIDSDGTERGRENESVVDSAVQKLKGICTAKGTLFRPQEVEAHVMWAIPPEHFDFERDPRKVKEEEYRRRNPKLYTHVPSRFGDEALKELDGTMFGIDLPVIIREQFGHYRINVETRHAYLPEGFHTTRNNDKQLRCLMAAVRQS